MEANDQSTPRPLQQQHHRSTTSVVDLFNVYLGRSVRQRPEASSREASSNKLLKMVIAPNRDLPPPDEQFIVDFELLRVQFSDHDQLREATESVLISLVIQCSGHAPQAKFLLFAIRNLCCIGYLKWDSFLLSLLSAATSAEASAGQGTLTMPAGLSVGTSSSLLMPTSSTVAILNTSTVHSSTPASPRSTNHGVGSPLQSSIDQTSEHQSSTENVVWSNKFSRGTVISSLRFWSCRIILAGLESSLNPVTNIEIFSHMLNWLVNWDHRPQGFDDADDMRSWRPQRSLQEWMHMCLDVVRTLVNEDKCRIPFYELIRSKLQLMDNIPDNESLFSILLEIHRRRDMVAMHMQMLDQHLHCPTFATHRLLSQAYPTIAVESLANLRYSPITYPSVLGEPLHGEDLAISIPRDSIDWERALRCLTHALRTTPSPDWWRRVLLVAPCYKSRSLQVSIPGAVFSCEMVCEAIIDRIMELLKITNSELQCWQEWLAFADIFFFIMKNGCIEFLDFIQKLYSRVSQDSQILQSNHVTWLLTQIIRIETINSTLNSNSQKVETTNKIISFHKEDKNLDLSNISPQSVLLDFISSSQTLQIWSFNISIRDYFNNSQYHKGKQIHEWWKQTKKGKHMMDFINLDDRSMGMFWVLSFTMAQPACEAVISWFTSVGRIEIFQGLNLPSSERIMMMQETVPLSITLLSGLSINSCLKLAYQLEENIFLSQVIPSISMVETYVRLLLIAPYSLFRPHFTTLTRRSSSIFLKSGVLLLLLEILNYRLFPLYRYHGKSKALLYDVTKIISKSKRKCGEHRLFRLAENLCMNLIFSIQDFFLIKKELKGPTDFTETLNRLTIMSLAITIKTRGIGEVEHMLYLQPLLEQIMSTSQHTWSEKTLRHFPPFIRNFLMARIDKKEQKVQAWQQAQTTIINQCTKLLSLSADPTYVKTYLSHSFPQHRQYLCAGVWMLMNGHPESINSANLEHVLREFTPEEVTSNIYIMVDVLLHHIQVELQHGHLAQVLLTKAVAGLAFFIWTRELLPMDILLLALIDRDDDPYALPIVINLLDKPELHQRIKMFCANRHSPEHWLNNHPPKRMELQKALGNHLSWKDRNPPFFDDIAARLFPVFPLIIYRLIENDAMDIADKVLYQYTSFLSYHPLKFTFVRDTLAYFYGKLSSKLILRLLKVLDISKIPLSESFHQHVGHPNSSICPPLDYFANLLFGLVNNVIPPLNSEEAESFRDSLVNSGRATSNNSRTTSQSTTISNSDGQRAFYQNQDPGTYTQLVLETTTIEILSLPAPTSDIVASLVQIVVHVQPTFVQSSNGLQIMSSGIGQPTSSGGRTESMNINLSTTSTTGINITNFAAKSRYSSQQLSCLLIQACGLLLAHLPPIFHMQLYSEASRIIKDCLWFVDGKRSLEELDSAIGYALLDPTSASQDNRSTTIGNTVALLHSFFSNLPQEWLESTLTVIKHLRPVTSVAMLRIAFRIMGPLLPRLALARPVFTKALALLLNVMADVFGKNSQASAREVSEIKDLIDFLHHVVMYEGQEGPVQATSKPKVDILALCGKEMELLRPDVQHLLSHLKTDQSSSIYAATHPKLSQNIYL